MSLLFRLAVFLLVSIGMTSSLEAQRHPESAGPLQYYRDDPGIQRLPEWQQRPDFLRGPRDRIERGPFRRFIYTGDGISNLNYADEKYVSLPLGQYGVGGHLLPGMYVGIVLVTIWGDLIGVFLQWKKHVAVPVIL